MQCEYLRTGWASLLRGTEMLPPAEAFGRGSPLRGGARERVGVDVAEFGVEVALTGCLKASGDGVVGVRSLLGEGTGRAETVRFILCININNYKMIKGSILMYKHVF